MSKDKGTQSTHMHTHNIIDTRHVATKLHTKTRRIIMKYTERLSGQKQFQETRYVRLV